jgi:hypothetical protein
MQLISVISKKIEEMKADFKKKSLQKMPPLRPDHKRQNDEILYFDITNILVVNYIQHYLLAICFDHSDYLQVILFNQGLLWS